MRGQVRAFLFAQEVDAGIFLRQFAPLRPVTDHNLGAGQVERQKRLDVLLDRDAAHGHEDRARQIEVGGMIRIEQFGIDAASPEAELAEAPRGELIIKRGHRHHRRRRRVMKPAQHRIGHGGRDDRADRDIFRKPRGVGGGKRKSAAQAIGPHRPADRAFGRDMNGFRRRRLDAPCNLAPVGPRDPQTWIGRQLHRGKSLGRQELDVRAERAGCTLERGQGTHHAINLRVPSVGRDQDSHQGMPC